MYGSTYFIFFTGGVPTWKMMCFKLMKHLLIKLKALLYIFECQQKCDNYTQLIAVMFEKPS